MTVMARSPCFTLFCSVAAFDACPRVLRSFVDYLFRPEAFESGFSLNMPAVGEGASGTDSELLLAPAELFKTHEQYLQWVDSLPPRDMPEWIGFNSRAEWLLASRQAHSCITNWSTLLLRGKEEALDFHSIAERTLKKGLKSQKSVVSIGDEGKPEAAAVVTSWLTLLIPTVQACMATLPETVPTLQRTEALVQNPMFRCFERELAVGAKCVPYFRAGATRKCSPSAQHPASSGCHIGCFLVVAVVTGFLLQAVYCYPRVSGRTASGLQRRAENNQLAS